MSKGVDDVTFVYATFDLDGDIIILVCDVDVSDTSATWDDFFIGQSPVFAGWTEVV